MDDNICAVCFRRLSAHTLQEAAICGDKFGLVELERTANQECISCGVPADICDPVSGEFYCHGCFSWLSQLNNGG